MHSPNENHPLATIGGVLYAVNAAVAGGIYFAAYVRAWSVLRVEGAPDALQFAYATQVMLITKSIGGIMAIVTSVLCLVALYVLKVRLRWFWWCVLISSAGLLVLTPVGTLVGIIMIFLLLIGRRDFLPEKTTGSPFPPA